MVCSINGCNRKTNCRGWCEAHYTRWRRYGDPCGGRTALGEPLRFLLSETAVACSSDDCLTWPYKRGSHGYGIVLIDGQRQYAHRIICEAAHGPAPSDRHEAAHSCGKGHEGCINPRHLRWATPKENCADTLIHGTHNRGERNGAAKLTEAAVRHIRQSGRNSRELSEKYGVVPATVRAVRRGANWAWL